MEILDLLKQAMTEEVPDIVGPSPEVSPDEENTEKIATELEKLAEELSTNKVEDKESGEKESEDSVDLEKEASKEAIKSQLINKILSQEGLAEKLANKLSKDSDSVDGEEKDESE